MNLEQRFELPLPPAQAWPLFKDVPMLVGCLPGASLSGPADPAALPLLFAIKIGPMSASFTGTGSVRFDDAARSGVFAGAALDRRTQSRVKGEARFALEATDQGTRVKVEVDYALTGPLAQFSRGAILREVANQLTAQFADNLRTRIAEGAVQADVAATDAPAIATAGDGAAASVGTGPQTPDVPPSAPARAPAGTAAPAPSMDLLSLLTGALRRWFARLVGRTS